MPNFWWDLALRICKKKLKCFVFLFISTYLMGHLILTTSPWSILTWNILLLSVSGSWKKSSVGTFKYFYHLCMMLCLLGALFAWGPSTYYVSKKVGGWGWPNADLSHRHHTMVDGTKFWISCQRLKLLRKASRWYWIQNLAPSTSEWCQCDIQMFIL